MEDYKPNSHRSKEKQQEKRVTKVVSGTAKKKRKNDIQKFADVFISEDVSNVKSYVMWDVLIPAIKKAISDIVVNGIDMILYGESGHTKRTSNSSRASYQSYYDRGNAQRTANKTPRRNRFDYDSILFNSRDDADAVLTELEELISVYGVASIMDLYSAAGLQCDYTYDRYGWSDLRSAEVIRAAREDGYYIRLPKAVAID